MPTACEMRMNSFLSGSAQCVRLDVAAVMGGVARVVLVQRFMKRVPSLRNSAGMLRAR